jgi:site-specific recombinase XerD
MAGFRFLDNKCDKSVPMKYIDYRPAKLVKGKRWYIEYYYRIPAELRPLHDNKEWERFKVNEDVNRYKDEEHAALLLDAVNEALKNGFNPFNKEQMQLAMEGVAPNPGIITIKSALEFFLDKYGKRGLEQGTMQKCRYAVELIREYFSSKGLLAQPINKVRKQHIENLLEQNKEEKKWGNRQYNNLKSVIYTVFEFLRKKELIEKNPVEDIESLKTRSKKHKYYDKQLFPKVTHVIKTNQPYLWYAVQFVYYLCVRSEKELMAIKVGDILDEGENFLFRAEVTKSDRDDLVPIDPHLKNVMQEMGLLEANKNHYIFSPVLNPSPRPCGKNFFARRFQNVRKEMGLSEDYTLYGFKHTRAVHLLREGVKLIEIMRLMRHTDIATTAKYVRDLGVDIDLKELHSKTKKI